MVSPDWTASQCGIYLKYAGEQAQTAIFDDRIPLVKSPG